MASVYSTLNREKNVIVVTWKSGANEANLLCAHFNLLGQAQAGITSSYRMSPSNAPCRRGMTSISRCPTLLTGPREQMSLVAHP
jgi:hypothetical protein